MKSSIIPKKHVFSERARSVSSARARSRDLSPKTVLNNSMMCNNSNVNSPSSKSIYQSNMSTTSNQSFSGGFNINELTFNVNDDHKTLINKNRKLCGLLIQASNRISQMNERVHYNEARYKKEKEDMVKKLDKITVNYKVYAESHQNFIKFKVEYDNLRRDYDHNYKILMYYEDIIKSSLANSIQVFKKLSDFLLEYKNQESSNNFLMKLRENYKGELRQYLNKIDGYNFRELFTQIKIINDEMEQYDAEIYRPKFPQNLDNSRASFRENYEKVIVPVVKNNCKANDKTLQSNSSYKEASPEVEEIKQMNYTNTEKSIKENEQESIGVKVNENIQQLYDTLYKNSIKSERKGTNRSASSSSNAENTARFSQRKKEWKNEEKKDSNSKENNEEDQKEKILVTAIYDFEAKKVNKEVIKKNELGFKKGDVLCIEHIQDTGWWLASLNGKSGLIPFNYIRIND